jgi:hypothetical protein
MNLKRFDYASNLTHKVFYILFAILILAVIGISIHAAASISAPNPGHNSTQIFIPVGNNKYITLQNAINYGYLLGQNVSVVVTTLLPTNSPYELANQVLLTYKGRNITLQSAIDNNVFSTDTLPSAITSVPVGGEFAAAINIGTKNGVLTLQNAINTDITLLKYIQFTWNAGAWSPSAATTCPTITWTRTIYCQDAQGSNLGTECGVYPGCDCPTPPTSTTTTCTWQQYASTNCKNIPPPGMPGTQAGQPIYPCSRFLGSSCSLGVNTCQGDSCSCGYGCGGNYWISIRCQVNSP